MKSLLRRLTPIFILIIPYSYLVYRFWWLCDDAFISFRYAKNWAMGNGPRFNLGDHLPVEGYSNFFWVVCATFCEWIRIDVMLWIPLLSALAGLGLVLFSYRTAIRHFSMPNSTALFVGLLISCSPSIVIWATSGLETMVFALLIFLVFERIVLSHGRGAVLHGIAAGTVLSLVRFEGIGWVVVLSVLGAFNRWVRPHEHQKSWWREPTLFLISVLACFSIYFAWRYSYYHYPFPNTFYAKVTFSFGLLIRGLHYILGYFLETLVPLLAFAGLPSALRYAGYRGFSVGVLALAFPVYAALVGGDFMTMGRILVPMIPFSAILLGFALQHLRERFDNRRILIYLGAFIVVSIGTLPVFDLHLIPEAARRPLHVRYNHPKYWRTEYQQWEFMKRTVTKHTRLGLAIRKIAKPGDSMVGGGIGATGYYSGIFIYDVFGLVTAKVAHRQFKVNPTMQSPGHDKKVKAVFFSKDKATYLRIGFFSGTFEKFKRVAGKWKMPDCVRKAYIPDLYDIGQGKEKLKVLRLAKPNENPELIWDYYQSMKSKKRSDDHLHRPPKKQKVRASNTQAILVVVDTLRGDGLGCYGYPKPTTPTIDAVAAQGIVFDNHFAASPWTAPSFGSILTGVSPTAHQMGLRIRNQKQTSAEIVRIKKYELTRLRHGVPTIAELLGDVPTGAIITNGYLQPQLGFANGFDTYDLKTPRARNHKRGEIANTYRRADETTADAIKWLKAQREHGFFLLVHYFDPHITYNPPEQYIKMFSPHPAARFPSAFNDVQTARKGRGNFTNAEVDHIRALYDGEVRFVDDQLGILFESLRKMGIFDQLWIAITADHGEEFFDHGGFEHGHRYENEVTKVPLVLLPPKGALQSFRGKHIATTVSHVDIVPTVLDWFGIQSPSHLEGKSLVKLLNGGTQKDRPVLMEYNLYGPLRHALVDGRYKFIKSVVSKTGFFYDLHKDPKEQFKLDATHSQHDILRNRLLAYIAKVQASSQELGSGGHKVSLTEELTETLRSLGYVE